jgi:hypothetical protein
MFDSVNYLARLVEAADHLEKARTLERVNRRDIDDDECEARIATALEVLRGVIADLEGRGA